ncbi:MAG: hypothetical protein OSB69_24030 [Alphaproteobacteria bacterium]|nr:hypothetical protein [Alphaproteobacteria bacterium]
MAAAEHVVGSKNGICAVCCDWNSEVGQCGKHINDAVAKVDSSGGVVIGADMMGGTS